MSEFNECKSCGQSYWMNGHRCPPMWKVAPIDGKAPLWDDSILIYADDPEEAACMAAREIDDYADDPPTRNLAVRPIGEEAYKIFEVHAETEVVYYSKEIDEDYIDL